jgi:N-acetyl-gamma-glutamyl-phosphate reductase
VTVDENVVAYGVAGHRHAPEVDQELALLGAPVTATVQPHLLPLDQGELVSCYVTTTRPWQQAELDAAYEAWSDAHPFIELSAVPPGVRDVRDTNICRLHVRSDPRTGKVLVFSAIDNLWKGSSSQAIQNLNLMYGFDETLGIEP